MSRHSQQRRDGFHQSQHSSDFLGTLAELGRLIGAKTKRVYVYTPEGVAELEEPDTLSAEPVLVGFTLELGEIW